LAGWQLALYVSSPLQTIKPAKTWVIKRGDRILLWAAAAVGAFVVWSKVRAISNLIFSPGSVTGLEMQGTVPFIYFTVYVQNTAGTGVTVDSFAGNIFANGQLVGNISNFTPVHISANSQTVVPLTAQLGLIGIVNTIIQAFTGSTISQEINVVGYANGVGFQVPINIKLMVGGANQ
jgi:LEA14-like dessication related protein